LGSLVTEKKEERPGNAVSSCEFSGGWLRMELVSDLVVAERWLRRSSFMWVFGRCEISDGLESESGERVLEYNCL
jgi:hypothetical protein